MEKEKVKPDSQAASPLPAWLEDQALSGQWLGAGDQEASSGNVQRPAVQSTKEDQIEKDLVHAASTQNISAKPLQQDAAEWDGVSILELDEDQEEQEERRGGSTGGKFLVPAPREAWMQLRQSELRSRRPPRASRPRLEPVSPFNQPPSRLRRALRALRSLFCCLAPQPKE